MCKRVGCPHPRPFKGVLGFFLGFFQGMNGNLNKKSLVNANLHKYCICIKYLYVEVIFGGK